MTGEQAGHKTAPDQHARPSQTPLQRGSHPHRTSLAAILEVAVAPILLKKSCFDGSAFGRLLSCELRLGARSRGPSRRFGIGIRDQLCQFAEVLGGCCEVELIAGAVRSS